MELDPAAWVVHRHLVDPCLDELDTHLVATEFGRSPILPIDLPIHLPIELWGLDTETLESLTLENRLLVAATDEVASAG